MVWAWRRVSRVSLLALNQRATNSPKPDANALRLILFANQLQLRVVDVDEFVGQANVWENLFDVML